MNQEEHEPRPEAAPVTWRSFYGVMAGLVSIMITAVVAAAALLGFLYGEHNKNVHRGALKIETHDAMEVQRMRFEKMRDDAINHRLNKIEEALDRIEEKVTAHGEQHKTMNTITRLANPNG